eukprot:332838_1
MCLDYYMALPEVERLEPHMRAAFISRPLRSIAFRTARLVFQDIELDSSGDLEWSTFKRIFFQSLGFPEDLVQAGGDHEDSRKGATPISVKKMDEETLNIVENYANPETEVYDRGAKTVVRKYFEKLVCATPLGQFIKKDNLKKRRIYNQIIEMGPEGRAESQELSNVLVDMFAYFNVTAEKQKDVCKAFKIIMFEPGDIVFNQGDQSTHFYSILLGSVQLADRTASASETASEMISTQHVGSTFGDIELVTRERRSLTASAREHTVLAILDSAHFREYMSPL